MASTIAPPPTATAAPVNIPAAQTPPSGWNTVAQIAGANNNTSATAQSQQQQGLGSTANTYNAAQTANQSALPAFYANLMNGQIPSSFTHPQAAIDAFNNDFQNVQAPNLALSGGAGSPMIARNQAMGLSNLESNLYNTGVSNYINALGAGTNNAYQSTGAENNTASSGAQQGTGAANQSYQQNDNSNYSALQSIINILQGTPGAIAGIGSIFGF